MNHSINLQLIDENFDLLPDAIRESRPGCALLLGSGWSGVTDRLTVVAECPYSQLPTLGATSVIGHAGRLLLGHLPDFPDFPVLAFRGRRHWYEGAGWEPVILPVEICRRLAVPDLLITNAAGGIRADLAPGQIVLLRDHLRMSHLNPLQGPHIPRFGSRFPDQSQVYDPALAETMRRSAAGICCPLAEGVYAFTAGPSFETPAEIRAYSMLGADVVGMSTVPEAMVASAAGLRVAAISLVSNRAAATQGAQLSHQEVIEVAKKAEPVMLQLLEAFIGNLAKEAKTIIDRR